ncbi:hypothetical protein Tco_0381384 [Tanacetum coccineum]
MVNPTIYTSCIKQFWATAKAKTVNGEVQIQALVDRKKVIITETSVRRALQIKDAEGTECLPNATIFAELKRMSAKTTAWNEALWPLLSSVLPQTKNSTFPNKQVEGMTKHKEIYVTPSHTKKVFSNMKREGKGFSGRVTPLFETMMVQAPEELDIEVPPPSGSITDEAANEEHVPVHSNDLLLSSEDRLKLYELMELCTNLSQRVLDLENTKTSQAAKITKLKERVKKLERRNKSRTPRLKRLRKVGRTTRIESSEDEVGCFSEECITKQGRKIVDLDADAEVEKVVSTTEVTTTNATTTTVDELTLAQTLIEVKAAKPKAVTTAAATTTTVVTRPKSRGVVVKEPSEFTTTTTSQPSQLPQLKTKVDSFVPMNTEVVEGSKSQVEGSKKRTREELESDNLKKQKIYENEEAEADDEAKMKKLMEIVPDDEVAIDAIPLAT